MGIGSPSLIGTFHKGDGRHTAWYLLSGFPLRTEKDPFNSSNICNSSKILSLITLLNPSAELQELKLGQTKIQNSSTYQAGGKVTPSFVSRESFIIYLIHPTSDTAFIAHSWVSLQVWDTSQAGLILPRFTPGSYLSLCPPLQSLQWHLTMAHWTLLLVIWPGWLQQACLPLFLPFACISPWGCCEAECVLTGGYRKVIVHTEKVKGWVLQNKTDAGFGWASSPHHLNVLIFTASLHA